MTQPSTKWQSKDLNPGHWAPESVLLKGEWSEGSRSELGERRREGDWGFRGTSDLSRKMGGSWIRAGLGESG